MDNLEKLKKLLHHWMEHNDEHARVYREWAEKTSALDKEEVSGILDRLYLETKKLNGLFEEALKKL
ncbi:MAG: hypothetical protein VST71_00225 [Nitrospirota bacterium]|nr:hypothetical protein [Nitrospirota bacterium]